MNGTHIKRQSYRQNGHVSPAEPPAIPPLPQACSAIIGRIPRMMRGESRIRYLAEQVSGMLAEDREGMNTILDSFMHHMISRDASDIDAGGPAAKGHIWFRIHGDKRPDEKMGRYSEDEMDLLFLNMLGENQIEALLQKYALDISWQLDLTGGERQRFRTTIYFDYDHLALNMRAVTQEVRPLKSLGFHPIIQRGLMFRYERDGLTLITGVTGSGKSTTLDAIIDENNIDTAAHVIIIGNPIEYMHESKRCLVRHREVGKDVRTFKDGIVQALRQDPDIIVIGEMRDPDTITAALEVTDSGHKVLSTLHTSSAIESIDRIIAEYPTEEQDRVRNRLADVLRCIISQKLCPKVGGGRILAKEVLWMQSSSRAAIKNNNAGEIYQMMWEGGAQGQITLEQDLFRLVRHRLISPDTAMNYANNKRRLQQLLS